MITKFSTTQKLDFLRDRQDWAVHQNMLLGYHQYCQNTTPKKFLLYDGMKRDSVAHMAKSLPACFKIILMRRDPVHQTDIMVEEPVKFVIIRLRRVIKIDQIPIKHVQVGNG